MEKERVTPGTRNRPRREKTQKVCSCCFGKRKFSQEIGRTLPLFLLSLSWTNITELTPSFQPPAPSKADYDIYDGLESRQTWWKSSSKSLKQDFYNHVQELAVFGALSPKEPSNSTGMCYLCAARDWFNLPSNAFTRLWEIINECSFYNINIRNAIKTY